MDISQIARNVSDDTGDGAEWHLINNMSFDQKSTYTSSPIIQSKKMVSWFYPWKL